MRKMLKTFGVLTALLLGMSAMQSCQDDDVIYYDYSKMMPNALVTVKLTDDNSFFLQLDDSTTLKPSNLTTPPFGSKEVRALVNYDETREESVGNYTRTVYVNWIDSILTKTTVLPLEKDNDLYYGTDPVDIIKDWVTIAEDGYLTLRFRTNFGYTGKTHFVNLLVNQNPENPYEVEFRHNAYGDTSGKRADGLVAFKLNGLPDTHGKTVKLKLTWLSFGGTCSAEFDYCTRKSTPSGSSLATEKGVIPLN